jgi:hypothetical protein
MFSNDSLLLFADYSRLNGNGKFNHDTVLFVSKYGDLQFQLIVFNLPFGFCRVHWPQVSAN